MSYTKEKNIPTNMSTENCNTSYCYYNGKRFYQDIEPKNNEGYTILNPDIIKNNKSKDFKPIYSKNNNEYYYSPDPRLIHVPYSERLILDFPPLTNNINSKNIETEETLDNYGQKYKDYSDINAGYITYYVNKKYTDAFYSPTFGSSANVYGTLYKDPMDSLKPQYNRESLKQNNVLNTQRKSYDGCLSWINDSNNFREDLISKQMRKRNQERYEPRWFN